MTVAAPPAHQRLRSNSLAAAPGPTTAMTSQRRQTTITRRISRSSLTFTHYIHAIQYARHRSVDQRHPPPQASSSADAPSPPPSNPHSVALLPAVSSLRGFPTPAPGGSPDRRATGRRPKPFSSPGDSTHTAAYGGKCRCSLRHVYESTSQSTAHDKVRCSVRRIYEHTSQPVGHNEVWCSVRPDDEPASHAISNFLSRCSQCKHYRQPSSNKCKMSLVHD